MGFCAASSARTRAICVWLPALAAVCALAPSASAQCASQWLPSDGLSGPNWGILESVVWDPDGPGPEPALLVVGGEFTSIGGVRANYIAAWDGSAWRTLGSGFNWKVSALTVYQGELIAGGYFAYTGNNSTVNYIARWDGTTWQPLGSGMNDWVTALTVYNGELIAGGIFRTAGGNPARLVARWNGSAWQSLGVPSPSSPSGQYVLAFAEHGGELVVGGFGVWAWNGTSWRALGSITDGQVSALTVHNSALIAAGRFTTADGKTVNHIARWNGATWEPVDSGMNNFVEALAVHDGELIAAGNFTSAGAVAAKRIARLTASGTWQPLGSGTNSWVMTIRDYNNELFAGGWFKEAGGYPAGYWSRWGVPEAPAISSNPSDQTICRLGSVTLSVAGAGSTPLQYSWRKNETVIDTASNPSAATPMLHLNKVVGADAGAYDCVVSNICDSAVSDIATLTVCAADYNCDGFVDGIDHDQFNNDFEAGKIEADINGDGFVDGIDYDVFNNAFEAGC